MDNLLQRVKEIDIRQVARDLGFEIIQSRRMNCPFHFEDSPSLIFYPPPQNEFHCFGCGKHGDVINLYADTCKIDFKTALEELASRYIPNYDGVRNKNFRKVDIKSIYSNKPLPEKKFEFKPIYTEIYERFQTFCLSQPATESARKAAEYLRGRGIDDWTIKHFRLFVIKNYVATNEFLKEHFSLEDLKGSGIVNDKGNLVFFVHPIIIPYYQDGRIIYLQGRSIGNPPEGASKYQFLSGVPRTIFNIDGIKKLRPNSEVYLTEGAFDCMTLVKNGMPAVSLGSAKTFKKEWFKYFKKYKVWISFDNDEAGINGTKTIIEDFLMAGILAEKKDWNKGFKDINEYFGQR
ncbi:zinc finger, CHC2-family protein [Emticicia oligotrophica DSM 17448]|uniref:Zinc finger, CHC2-family protein n=1 Tax=Emticicia oligotrophica (strain DSM 17448 / CIP 109782 / MTCC 6937 / GPTSA100-15) TaxID=929562 RepID=A0ABM5N5P4_EMTOG|nr:MULTISPECIES: CHC2 zinc finger domain-containing protein [Emticicia]AFK04788.1 zinc finger, CHC2-family protein [Emticicia oligotrophica DSM 17448]